MMTDNFSPRDGSHTAAPATGQGTGSTQDSGASSAKTDAAKQQAGDVAQEAKGHAAQVGETAKSEAAEVASEVKKNAKDLYAQARTDLAEQAGTQQQKVVDALRSIADEFHSMENAGQSGIATDLVGQAATRASSAATWLDGRDPGSIVGEVRKFARRRPVAFLAIAAGAGFLAGRLNKSLSAGPPASTATDTSGGSAGTTGDPGGQHVAAPVPPVPGQHPTVVPAGGGAVADPFGSEPVRQPGAGPASAQTLPPTPPAEVPVADPRNGGRL